MTGASIGTVIRFGLRRSVRHPAPQRLTEKELFREMHIDAENDGVRVQCPYPQEVPKTAAANLDEEQS